MNKIFTKLGLLSLCSLLITQLAIVISCSPYVDEPIKNDHEIIKINDKAYLYNFNVNGNIQKYNFISEYESKYGYDFVINRGNTRPVNTNSVIFELNLLYVSAEIKISQYNSNNGRVWNGIATNIIKIPIEAKFDWKKLNWDEFNS